MTQVQKQAGAVAEQSKSMARLAGLLKERGFRVNQVMEALENGVRHTPTITIHRDSYGLEAAEIALEHGYHLGRVSYRYDYLCIGRSKPFGVMKFTTSCMLDVGKH